MNSWSYSFQFRAKHSSRILAKFFWLLVKAADFPRRYLSSQSFSKGAITGTNFRGTSSAFCVNLNTKTKIRVGNNVVCRGVLRAEKKGEIEIGDNSYVGDATIINAMGRVLIGDNVLIAQNCFIVDNNTHPLDVQKRAAHYISFLEQSTMENFDAYASIEYGQIEIGNNAWVGAGSIILKNVKIGEGAIIGAGSIVSKDVPAFTTVVGNPAKEIAKC